MPRCAHGNDGSRCSQCAGAVPRVVTQVGAELLVDGVAARPVAPKQEPLGPMRVGKRRRKP